MFLALLKVTCWALILIIRTCSFNVLWVCDTSEGSTENSPLGKGEVNFISRTIIDELAWLFNFLVPIMGLYPHRFDTLSQMLEQNVSRPRDLNAFTMVFQVKTNNPPRTPVQIACYGNEGEDCRLSVVINANFTLGIIIESTR